MLVVKILIIILGSAFLLFGYFIYFHKKYNLINGFSADYKAGRKDEKYAKRIGLIELILGIVLLITQTSHTETPEKADNQAENR